MSKERFEDTTMDLAKALYHISIGKKYFEMIMVDKSYNAKMIFQQYVNKCDWIERNIYDRLKDETRAMYKESIIKGDTVFFDSCSEKLLLISESQKQAIEQILDSIIKGETIEITLN